MKLNMTLKAIAAQAWQQYNLNAAGYVWRVNKKASAAEAGNNRIKNKCSRCRPAAIGALLPACHGKPPG